VKVLEVGDPVAIAAWQAISDRVWRHRPVLPAADASRFASICTRLSGWATGRHFVSGDHATVTAWCLPGGDTGHLGLYAAMPEAAAVHEVLNAAISWLHGQGVHTVLGPIDGDAWERSRFSLGPDDAPPFMLEPENPPEDPKLWQEAGGVPSHRVLSQRQDDPAEAARILGMAAAPAREAGYRIVPLTSGNWRRLMLELHPMIPEVFAGGLTLGPLGPGDFLARFAPMAPLWRSGLSFVAMDAEGSVVGFLLGVPDLRPWLGRAGGVAGRMTLAWRIRHPRRAVLKTLGVARAHRRSAVGHALAHAFHARAAELEVPEVIHALMAEDNPSFHMSRSIGGRPVRAHLLYGWHRA